MTYLITGATGNIGSRVVDRLVEQGHHPRVLVRDEARARSRFGDKVDVRIGDLADSSSIRPALEGVDELFLVNSGPQIPLRDAQAASVARAAKVRHIVKLSSLDVEQHLAIGAWHELGESAIRETGIAFTFVRPTGFMSNLLAWRHSILAEGMIRASTGDGRRPFIHPEDVAAVATAALTSGKFAGQSLALTGPQALSFAEVTAKVGSAIGKPLKFQAISDEDAARRFCATGASREETEAHVELWRAIREGRLAAIVDGVRQVLDREPMSLDQWLTENAGAFC